MTQPPTSIAAYYYYPWSFAEYETQLTKARRLVADDEYRRMMAARESDARQVEQCNDFDRERVVARRRAVRAVVETTQRLGAVAPTFFGSRKGKNSWSLPEYFTSEHFESQLTGHQRFLLEEWRDAHLAALAEGVSESFLKALLRRSCRSVPRPAESVSGQFAATAAHTRILANSILRHGPPLRLSAAGCTIRTSAGEVLTAA